MADVAFDVALAPEAAPVESPARRALRRLLRRKGAVLGLAVIAHTRFLNVKRQTRWSAPELVASSSRNSLVDLVLKPSAFGAIADDFAGEIDIASGKFGAGVDEVIETFEGNEPAHTEDPRGFV